MKRITHVKVPIQKLIKDPLDSILFPTDLRSYAGPPHHTAPPTPTPARDFGSILDTNLEGLSPSEEVDRETYLQSIPTRERRRCLGWQSIPDLGPWFAKVVFLVN